MASTMETSDPTPSSVLPSLTVGVRCGQAWEKEKGRNPGPAGCWLVLITLKPGLGCVEAFSFT